MHTQGMLAEGTLKGKVAVITGGGTGLGRSMTEYLKKLGADVLITGRRAEVLQKTCDELNEMPGGKATFHPCDVREYHLVEEVADKAYSELGGVDILINCAAGNFISPTERLSHRAFHTIVDIVLKGSANCTLAFGKRWIEEKKEKAKILNIVTTYATTGSGFVVPSATAKSGVVALTRSLAVEWSKYNIYSNAIAPGPFPTEGAWTRLFPPSVAQSMDITKKIPVGRTGHHQELANLAAYLVSDYADFINGEVVTIDGGEWLKGAGEFNFLDVVSQQEWDMIEQEIRKRKGK